MRTNKQTKYNLTMRGKVQLITIFVFKKSKL